MGENDKIDRLLSLEVRGTDLAAINDAVDEIDRLLQEIKRLREMHGNVVVMPAFNPNLCSKVEKELGNE